MKFRSADIPAPEINVTPMIDIVFQLIAFFMVVINFEQTQADERVKLPRDELARPMKKARPNELIVNIGFQRNRKGDITSAPFIRLTDEARDFSWPNDEDALKKTIKRIAGSRKRDKTLGKTTIVIRADSYCPSGITTDIIDIAQRVGFEKFAFAATQKAKSR